MNNYDLTKYLLQKTRDYKRSLNEMSEINSLRPNELEDEQEKLKTAVGGMVEFGAFKIYKDNIEWVGSLPVEKINWNFSLDTNTGCYISTSNTQLSELVLDKLQKLGAYYNVWAEYWTNEMK